MFVELIEHLRCPRDHAETVLIAAADQVEARHIMHGTLGCPACGAEYAIADGVTTFEAHVPPTPAVPASSESAMRLAAFLELTDARGFVLLCGAAAAHADLVARIAATPLVLVNPPEDAASLDVAAVIRVRERLPFAPGSVRAIALDDAASAALAASAVAVVRPGGRVTAPVGVALPEGLTELVRDDRDWVAERVAASPPVSRLVSLERNRSANPRGPGA